MTDLIEAMLEGVDPMKMTREEFRIWAEMKRKAWEESFGPRQRAVHNAIERRIANA